MSQYNFNITGQADNRKIATVIIENPVGQIDANVAPIFTPELKLDPLNANQYGYIQTTIQVPTDAIDKVLSMMYAYRPLFERTNALGAKHGYDAAYSTAANNNLLAIPLVAIRNINTGQVTYIGPDNITYSTFTDGAATLFETMPLIVIAEGAIPFFAMPGDNLEVIFANANFVNNTSMGTLQLQLCNFEVTPYSKVTKSFLTHQAT